MSSNANSVSFVVPCYRNLRTIGFTLRSILSQEDCPASEVSVIDSSEDSVADWLRARFPAVRLIRPDGRLWAGAARNLGAARARGEFLAFVDADAVLRPNWFRTLRDRLTSAETTRVVGGSVENANPDTQASRILHWSEFSEFLPGSRSGFRTFLSSSNLLLRRADFVQTEGFPEHLPASEDRLFLSHLLERPGSRAYWEGSTGIFHYHRSRWSEVRAHLYHLGYWGGRVRAEDATLRGGQLIDAPSAALLLPLYRTPLVALRVCRAQPRRIPAVLALTPLIFVALSSWAYGFRNGLKGIEI